MGMSNVKEEFIDIHRAICNKPILAIDEVHVNCDKRDYVIIPIMIIILITRGLV